MSNSMESLEGRNDQWQVSKLMKIQVVEMGRKCPQRHVYFCQGMLPIRIWDDDRMSLAELWLASNQQGDILDWNIEALHTLPLDYSPSIQPDDPPLINGNDRMVRQLLEALDTFLAIFPGYIYPADPNNLIDPWTDDTVVVWNWREGNYDDALRRIAGLRTQPKHVVSDFLTLSELRKALTRFVAFNWPLLAPPI